MRRSETVNWRALIPECLRLPPADLRPATHDPNLLRLAVYMQAHGPRDWMGSDLARN